MRQLNLTSLFPLQIREMIDRALNEDGDDEDGPVKGSSSAAHDLGLPEQPLSMEGISVSSDDVLEPAGMVLSVFDGMVVVQGLEGPKALDESSVLCLGDRTVIGRVEEVFGPVTCPLYALRWAGKQDAPSSLCSGANVFSVPRLCGFIPLDEIKSTRERASIDVLGADEGEEEVYFSDDEQEAEFMKVRSKRKADFTRQPPPKESGSRPNKGSGLNVPPAPGRGGGRGRGHAAAHQPSSSSHFRAMATASHMQSVALSDERGPKARQGSIMSSQYAPPQSSYQSASLYSALMPYMMPQPQPGASFPFQPTGYGAPPPHFPLFPPHPQYPPM
jgi:rRNA processing protein Gar1